MPYSIWLTTHTRYEDVLAGAPDQLTLEDLRSCLSLLDKVRSTREVRRPDGATWVFRVGEPPALAPMLTAGVRPDNGPKMGTIRLSVSNTSPYFLANFFEMMSFAAFVNETEGLNAFEEVHGHALTVESVQQLTDVQGAYSRQQAQLWQQRRENLYTNVQMPLEFPAGQHDEGPNLLALRLEHPKLPPLTKLLAEPPLGQGVEVEGDRGLWFDRDSSEPVTWFILNPHAANQLILWPHWGQAPFANAAHATFDAATRLQSRTGGRVLWNGEPVTPKRTAWLQHYPELLGVELLQLAISDGSPPAARSSSWEDWSSQG
jgi:hypothetical protein